MKEKYLIQEKIQQPTVDDRNFALTFHGISFTGAGELMLP